MNALWNEMERAFGAVLGATPKPEAPVPEGETVDCTDVQIANTDIPVPAWEPPQGEPERPTLPGHEHQLDPGTQIDKHFDALLLDIRRMVAECPPAFGATERRL